MSDLISRSALIESLISCKALGRKSYEAVVEVIKEQPTVEPVRGEWKYYKKQRIAVCSNCSFERNLDDNFGRAISCPNCGCDMRGEKND